MRNKCVRWAKLAVVTLTIFIVAGVHRSDGALSAQSVDPLTQPRLNFSDITYMGAFRLPATVQLGDFNFGGAHMAFNPATNSLFVSNAKHKVAEVTIPAALNTADISRMPFASYLQGFYDPTEGHLADIGNSTTGSTVLAGLLVHQNKLYGTGSIYYDANNQQVVSHFSHSTNLAEPSFSGFSQVWETGKAGFVGGYMTNVPAQWRALLGGPAITGQCCIPIVRRTSFGPGAFGFDPAGMGANTALPATPLLYYPEAHQTLGPWLGSNEVYGASALMGGVALINGTRTALFIGRIGLGEYCYGKGVTDPAQHGLIGPDGMQCYDPGNTAKGQHGGPYRYQIWAYDLADFAAVKAGTKQPWDVVPYAFWPFELPTPEITVQIGGVAYDEQRQLLYISQMYADVDGLKKRPIIHTLKVNLPSSTAPPLPSMTLPIPAPGTVTAPKPAPAPTTTTTTTTTTTVAGTRPASVSLLSSLQAPQPLGSTIAWTATQTGGTGTLVYKWLIYDGVWTPVGSWSTSNKFSWKPTVGMDKYRVKVWVKRATSTADAAEASFEQPFAINGTTKVASVTLSASLPAPQRLTSSVVWTATQTGGTGALVYKWLVFDGVWKPVGTWGPSNKFTWTPTVAMDKYRVKVWVKRSTNTADAPEASWETPFAIKP